MESLPQKDFVTVLVTVWAIWYVRHEATHEHTFQSPFATHQFITRYIAKLEASQVKQHKRRPAAVKQRRRGWIPPPAVFETLKVDGTVARSANTSAYSAVCRDSSGLYMGSPVIKCSDVLEPASFEALACREAMALAKDLWLGNIVVASDWKEVIQDIQYFFGGKHASNH